MQETQETRARFLGWEHPWRRKWKPTPVFLPGKFHRQRSLVGYSPWGPREWDTTEHTNTQTHPTAFPKGWNTQQFHQQGLRWLCSLHEIKRTFNGPVNLMLPCWFLFLLLLKDVIDYEWCIPPLRTSKNQGGASQVAQTVKESACNAGDLITIPGLGRSPGGGHRNPL